MRVARCDSLSGVVVVAAAAVVACAALVAGAPAGAGAGGEDLPPSCDSKIYCQGELLSVIQNAHLYPDSKKFVDKRLIYSPDETLEQFDALMKQTGGNPSKEQIQKFVDDYFEDGNELEGAELPDWVAEPALLRRIADPKLRGWASELNGIWKNLSRRVSDEVRDHKDRYSLIYVPHHFIVPGGRFRELYYWDTYWIVRGLLLSDMKDTVKGIIENFLYLLDTHGIIPNGARIYYLERSQPPLLTPMVYNYFLATKDEEFVKKNIHLLERELDFWMKNRTVNVQKDGKTYTLLRYYSPSQGPRPESYREDYMNSQVFSSDQRKEEFYIDLKSAAESGWDFSSRWFIKDGSNKGNLTDIHTKYIIPVDVNAFVYGNARLLSALHTEVVGNLDKAKKYSQIAHELKEAVTAVLWNGTTGSWFDYDLLNAKQRTYFYPSNLAPLWTKCYNEKETPIIAQKVVKYLQSIEILQHYLGGIPTSLNNTGEQWDLPNAWPPLQNIIIQGLQSTQEPSAQKLAYEFAEQWIRSNYKGFVEHNDMYEKYDAEVPGNSGGGGEYIPQSGFGWTNGVVLELLDTYGTRLTADNTMRREV
ncbi:hypothetical protein R5R35_014540 [Gryllus longicercus]|uniref:Trehalase n=1 Tax=Gryllus longicercus TaxID=2509291 RepID=A0AAN9VDU7_9ORTH